MSPKPRRPIEPLIAALAGGMSYADAAVKVGCCRKTIVRRMKDATFRERVQAARVALLDQSIGKLAGALSDAIDCLRGIATTAESEHARVSAAGSLLRHLLPLKETLDHESRIADLERSLCTK